MSSKQSRIHPNYKTKYRVTNWPGYNRSLVQRGDVTMWLSPARVVHLFGRPPTSYQGMTSDTVSGP